MQYAIDGIVALLGGEKGDLTDIAVDDSGQPDFNKRVYAIVRKIPAGAELVWQMHYTPNGKAAKDRSQMGLIFYKGKEPPKWNVQTRGITPPSTHPTRSRRRSRLPRGRTA